MLKLAERTLVDKVVKAVAFDEGRKDRPIEYLVIHVTQAEKLTSTDNWFTHPDCPVSAHYGISRAGEVHQYVSEYDTAHHAGNREINRRSIGIEHAGISGKIFTILQVNKSAMLAARIVRGHKIPIENIIPHGTIKGTTHVNCPGPTWHMDNYKKLVQYYITKL